MRCPYCHTSDSKVVDSRGTDDFTAIRRRRECINCGDRFTTYERVEELPLLVKKKSGERELFDKNKIISGLLKACEKRGFSPKKLEEIAEYVETELRNKMENEISTNTIGELVMEKLLAIDEVAYVRFASVYRQFKDINKFRQELDRLLAAEKEKER